ncbi:MAG: RNA polymerase sigma factor [Clostridia bacterium]|nr:RNA polymerase sigma factor [Clostridia bacterium]
MNEMLKLLDNKDLLDKIYRFCYQRCSTSVEAEDLCSEIIISVITAIHKQEHIENFYAFLWTIARRVYADHCRSKIVKQRVQYFKNEDFDNMFTYDGDDYDDYIEEDAAQEQFKEILKEISFLSKSYREVMVMHYIDGLSVKDIAKMLDISETAVKQRLFTARNSVKKEVVTMLNRNYVLKPVTLYFIGKGSPCGNDPAVKNERSFSQNLVYLCKKKPMSAKELSDKLGVPMPYIEEELEIQCNGVNGSYGTLRKLPNGKYTVNIHLVDYDEYERANHIFEKHLPEFCTYIKSSLKQNEERILNFPFLSDQKDLRFILWSLISRTIWNFKDKVNEVISEKYFSGIALEEAPFHCTAIAYSGSNAPDIGVYGCDGIHVVSTGGYKSVSIANIYGERISPHFRCGTSINHDSKIMMLIKSVGGICLNDLSDDEKEIAAKALQCGYLRKKGDILEPAVIVIDKKDRDEFFSLSYSLTDDMKELVEIIAAEITEFVSKHVPEHLICEYQTYVDLIAGSRLLSKAIEACISEGLLTKPQNKVCSEGTWMIVER